MRKSLMSVLCFCVLLGSFSKLLAQKGDANSTRAAKQSEQLARVGILRFVDFTGTKNFGYMPTSLADAIDISLQKKFEYIRVDPKRLEEIAARQKKSAAMLTRADVKAIAKTSQTDLLIFGYFTFDQQKNELVIQTDIFVESVDRLINLPEVRNTVDDSIFQAVDRVAQNIVEAMAALAAEAARTEDGGGKDKEKSKITTESIKEEKKPVVRDWSKKQWLFGFNVGAALPFGELGEMLNSSFGNPMLWVNYRWYQNYTAGIEVRGIYHNFENKYQNNRDINLDFTLIGVNLGYNFYLHPHWMVAPEITGGYYMLLMEEKSYRNPYVAIQASGRYLIFSWFGMESRLRYTYFYDEPVGLSQVDATIGLVITF